jgi:hypothetical protein
MITVAAAQLGPIQMAEPRSAGGQRHQVAVRIQPLLKLKKVQWPSS